MMLRLVRRAFAITACALLVAGMSAASVPVPELSTTPECLTLEPVNGASMFYRVTVVGTAGPLNAALVTVNFKAVADTLICWCNPRPTPRPPSFSASTNVSGVVEFNILGGGCIEYLLAAIPGTDKFAGDVFANGVRMGEFGTVSADAVDNGGNLPTSTLPVWDPAGSCAAGLADAVAHTTPLATATYDYCTDFNCDEVTGLADATTVTPYLASGASCPGNAGP